MSLRVAFRGLLACISLGGCVSFEVPPSPVLTDSVLAEYISDLSYPQSRTELAGFIVEDIKEKHAWLLRHDLAYQRMNRVSDTAPFLLKGDKADVAEIGDAIKGDDESMVFLQEESEAFTDNEGRVLSEHESRPIEFYGAREVYVLEQSDEDPQRSSIRILDLADRKRLYSEELKLYERIAPHDAALLKQLVFSEHP